MRVLFLGFTDELLPALGAGDGDLALASGNTNHLTALGAVIVAVLTVFQPVEELEEFPVFLIPGIGIPGKAAVNGPDHQAIGNGGKEQIDPGILKERRDQASYQAGAQNRHIQPVGAIATRHETLHPGGQLRQKLSEHRDNSL